MHEFAFKPLDGLSEIYCRIIFEGGGLIDVAEHLGVRFSLRISLFCDLSFVPNPVKLYSTG